MAVGFQTNLPESATRTRLLKPQRAAEFLGLSPSTLAKWRMTGDGPKFVRMGAGAIRYTLEDLQAFIVESTQRSTAAYVDPTQNRPGRPRKHSQVEELA